MPELQFQRENITGLWEELEPRLRDHWTEIATWLDIDLDPDTDAYAALEEADMLRVFTARTAAGRLVGYAAYFVRSHLHYQHSRQASQDVLYLAPEYRRGRAGIRLIRYVDAALAAEGVQVVYQHVKAAHDFGPVLEHEGYFLAEKIYAKRLS